MAKPVPDLSVPVITPQTGIMLQAWYEFFQAFQSAFNALTSQTNLLPTNASIALLYSTILRVINPQSGTTYTFVIGDSGKYCRFTSASAVTVTVPPHSSVAFAAGTQIDLIQAGAGKLTLAQGAGVTINSINSNKSAAARYAGLTLIQTDTLDTWDLVGSLIP